MTPSPNGRGSNQYTTRPPNPTATRHRTAAQAAAVTQPVLVPFEDLDPDIQQDVINRYRDDIDRQIDNSHNAADVAARFGCWPVDTNQGDVYWDDQAVPACWWEGSCTAAELDTDYLPDNLSDEWELAQTALAFTGSSLEDWNIESDQHGVFISPDPYSSVVQLVHQGLVEHGGLSEQDAEDLLSWTAEWVNGKERITEAASRQVPGYRELVSVVEQLRTVTGETYTAEIAYQDSDEGIREFFDVNERRFYPDGSPAD